MTRSPGRIRKAAIAVTLLAAAFPLAASAPAGADTGYPQPAWAHQFGGWNRTSSPTIADVDGDGYNDIAVGGMDGYVRVLDAATGTVKPGWPRPVILNAGHVSAVEGSPAVADLNNDGTAEVIVGVGPTGTAWPWDAGGFGGIVVFNRNGTTRCVHLSRDMGNAPAGSPIPDGIPEAVFSSPAVGDVDGDGYKDIVAGGFDMWIHVIDRNCNWLPGAAQQLVPTLSGNGGTFVEDSIWSSPALYDVDGDRRQEIFVGNDQTAGGVLNWSGGEFRRYDRDADGLIHYRWGRRVDEVISSSPAIGDIDGDGRVEVVVGTGFYFKQTRGSAAAWGRVFAWHADDGSDVPGWAGGVFVNGHTFSSPALGDLDGDGRPEVVVGSGDGNVYAIRGNGALLRIFAPPKNGTSPGPCNNPAFPHGPVEGSPIIADLDGNGTQDVAFTNAVATYLFYGQTGAMMGEINCAWSSTLAPAVGYFGAALGWRLVTVGFRVSDMQTRMAAYSITTPEASPAWPMFHKDSRHRGAPPSDPLPPAWHSEYSDGSGGSGARIVADLGQDPSAGIYGGLPHTYFHDEQNGNLRHGWWTGKVWQYETLDGAGGPWGRVNANAGESPAYLTYGGVPHVWYYDQTNGNLRHGWWTGLRWVFETLDGGGGGWGRVNRDAGRWPAAMLYGGMPHVWYHDVTNGNLRHGWWTGFRWMFETLDGGGGPAGRINAAVGAQPSVTLYAGGPHVFYADTTNHDLRHGWWTGKQWSFETLDGGGGPAGRTSYPVGMHSASVLYAGRPHIWYRNEGALTLRHGWWNGRQWSFETLDGAGGGGGRVQGNVGEGLAVTLYGGMPHAFYYDRSGGNLRHGWWSGTAWGFEILDGSSGARTAGRGGLDGDVGESSGVTVWLGAQLHLFYHDTSNTDLRHAWYA